MGCNVTWLHRCGAQALFICEDVSVSTEITDAVEIKGRWQTKPAARSHGEEHAGAACVFYDGSCPFCTRWAHRYERSLKARGFRIAALQSTGVAESLSVEP